MIQINRDKFLQPLIEDKWGKRLIPKQNLYDASKAGGRALTDATMRKEASALIPGVNAVPFDPNAG